MPRKNLFRVMSSSGDNLRCLNAKNASIHKVFLLNLITFTVRIFLYFLFQSQYKKYTTGHKVVWAPYSKAVESLKKFRKKSRNKPMFEEQKEAQVVHISFFISKFYLFADLTEYNVIGRFFRTFQGRIQQSVGCLDSIPDLSPLPQ